MARRMLVFVVGVVAGVAVGILWMAYWLPALSWERGVYTTYGGPHLPSTYFHKASGRCFVALVPDRLTETGQDVCLR